MEKRGRKISSVAHLRVRGNLQVDGTASNKGVPAQPFKAFSAVVRTVGDGADFFTANFNTLGSNPTLVHDSAGSWTLRFASGAFSQFTVAIIATLDQHPTVTYDFVGDAWFNFKTLSGGVAADNLVTFLRVLIMEFV
jgi:hypothetical protein